MRHSAFVITFLIAMVLTGVVVFAQHTPGAKFDLSKPLNLRGTVTQIDWATPNVHILMKVGAPNPVVWAVEVESPLLLAKNGWAQSSLPVGETITVQGFAARDKSNQISGNSIVRVSTGKAVYAGANGAIPPRAVASGPTPRWPSGQPRLGPTTGQTGYWGNPSRHGLVQEGVNVEMDAYGLLKNIKDVDRVAPLQKWARDLYELRQRNFLKDDPMFLFCKPPGGPRQYQQVYGFQFVEDPDFKRIWVLVGGGNRNRRVMYLDGRKQVGQIDGDSDNPLYYGRAVGQWEGDTLVMDLKGFNEKFWFDNGGLPHTDQLHLIERFTRKDMKTMHYEVTIDDPGAYTKTWKSSWDLEWIPGEETPYFLCQDNRP